jgi:hypothetical protein
MHLAKRAFAVCSSDSLLSAAGEHALISLERQGAEQTLDFFRGELPMRPPPPSVMALKNDSSLLSEIAALA